MDSLPAELITLILTFLDFRQAIYLQQLCSAVHAAVTTLPNQLLNSVNLRRFPIPAEWLIAKAPAFRTVIWRWDLPYSSMHAMIEENHSVLRSLDLSYSGYELRHDLFAYIPQIEQLVLVDCRLTDEVIAALAILPNLTHLNINHNPEVTGWPLVDLPHVFESFSYEGCYLLPYAVCHAVVERSASRLTELCIHGRYYASEQVEFLLDAARGLTQFNVSHAQRVEPCALEKLRGPQLQRLRFLNAGLIQNSEFCGLFSRCTSQLKVLDLSNCPNVGDYAMHLVARNCPDLAELCLCLCRNILDAGVVAIVQGCSKMKLLNLVDTLITEGALPLDRHYAFYDSIQKIDLARCYRISRTHAAHIRRRYPHVLVTRPHRGGWKHLMPMHSWVL